MKINNNNGKRIAISPEGKGDTLPERNVLLTLQFDGSRYHGFQVQKDVITITEVFQDAVEKALGTRWDIKPCSRTDSGVHATKYCLSMRFSGAIPAQRLGRTLNQFLPEDIAVTDAVDVPLSFHARYHSDSKEYTYYVHNSFIKDVFRPTQSYMFRYPTPMDEEFIHKQAQDFVGTKDFKALCGDLARTEDTVRTVYSFSVARKGDSVIFTVRGDGFLYNMVRIMVGTLLHISIGRIPANSIPEILASRDRLKAGITAPARGLYLTDVTYPKEAFGGYAGT